MEDFVAVTTTAEIWIPAENGPGNLESFSAYYAIGLIFSSKANKQIIGNGSNIKTQPGFLTQNVINSFFGVWEQSRLSSFIERLLSADWGIQLIYFFACFFYRLLLKTSRVINY